MRLGLAAAALVILVLGVVIAAKYGRDPARATREQGEGGGRAGPAHGPDRRHGAEHVG